MAIVRASACRLSLALLLVACGPKDPGGTGGPDTGSGTGDATTGGTAATESAGTTGGTVTVTGDPTTGPVEPTTGATLTSSSSSTTGDVGLECPAGIDAAILACVADLQSDPELAPGNFLLDLLLMCGDAEPVADDYDAHCAGHREDPVCSLDYQQFVETVLPACIARAQDLLFADVCLLPATHDALLFAPAIALMSRRLIDEAAELDATEQEQLVRMTVDLGIAAGTAEEALLATDNHQVEQLTVLDVGTDRVLVLYTAPYAGARAGRMFFRQTFTMVGAVDDGLFSRCGVERTVEGRPCDDDLGCDDGFVCQGVLDGKNGACAAVDVLPGTGDACDLHDDCVPTGGLLCLDVLEGEGTGECRPGWMRHSFAGPADSALIAGGTLSLPIVVSGVATFPSAAYLDFSVAQDDVNALAIRLINPAGTSTLIDTGDSSFFAFELAPVEVPINEEAVGVWHLAIEDLGGAAGGTVTRVGLTLDTRPD